MVKIDVTCYLKGDNFSEKTILDNTSLILHSVKSSKKNEDRKSVVQGKSVDLGGRRIIKKKNKK